MVLFENVHVFNSRSENNFLLAINHKQNKFLWISVFTAFGLHFFSMYNPFMQSVLGLKPVEFSMWISLGCIALLLILVMEAEKFIRMKFFSV